MPEITTSSYNSNAVKVAARKFRSVGIFPDALIQEFISSEQSYVDGSYTIQLVGSPNSTVTKATLNWNEELGAYITELDINAAKLLSPFEIDVEVEKMYYQLCSLIGLRSLQPISITGDSQQIVAEDHEGTIHSFSNLEFQAADATINFTFRLIKNIEVAVPPAPKPDRQHSRQESEGANLKKALPSKVYNLYKTKVLKEINPAEDGKVESYRTRDEEFGQIYVYQRLRHRSQTVILSSSHRLEEAPRGEFIDEDQAIDVARSILAELGVNWIDESIVKQAYELNTEIGYQLTAELRIETETKKIMFRFSELPGIKGRLSYEVGFEVRQR